MGILRKLFEVLVTYLVFDMCYGLEDVQHSLSGSSDSGGLRSPTLHYCNHKHAFHDEDHHHHHHNGHDFHRDKEGSTGLKLPEELAEEEDLEVYGLGIRHEHDRDSEHELEFEGKLHGVGLWVRAIGCSLLVSMASLICLIILPLIFIQGKPSKLVVDSLAVFGAGAMLGDAFLHQLPHAFGGENSNSHDHDGQHMHHHHLHTANMHSHSHSLKDLSVGLSILAGIVVFLLVEKAVRFVEGASVGGGHGHHHHLHKKEKKLKDDSDNIQLQSLLAGNNKTIETQLKENISDSVSGESLKERRQSSDEPYLRKRNLSASPDEKFDQDAANCALNDTKSQIVTEPAHSSSNLVFGYLNLFSDGVHNFTDGMALGSAFLLHGSLGGWSRTLFLLAHELPQEVGDFGILVRSGFSVPKALFFNFLSALAALLGTALALLLGQDPGQSWLIEGFTAGGFIYIAVAGVLAEMNGDDDVTVKGTAMQLSSLILGAMVALCISLVE